MRCAFVLTGTGRSKPRRCIGAFVSPSATSLTFVTQFRQVFSIDAARLKLLAACWHVLLGRRSISMVCRAISSGFSRQVQALGECAAYRFCTCREECARSAQKGSGWPYLPRRMRASLYLPRKACALPYLPRRMRALLCLLRRAHGVVEPDEKNARAAIPVAKNPRRRCTCREERARCHACRENRAPPPQPPLSLAAPSASSRSPGFSVRFLPKCCRLDPSHGDFDRSRIQLVVTSWFP